MKLKNLFLAIICLVGLTLVGCEKSKDSLANTTWTGRSLQTRVIVSFTDKECNIAVHGYCEGNATASYVTDNSTVTVTVNSLSGDFDGQLAKGEKITATYDLKKGKMIASKEIYGRTVSLELTLGDGDNSVENEPKPEPEMP